MGSVGYGHLESVGWKRIGGRRDRAQGEITGDQDCAEPIKVPKGRRAGSPVDVSTGLPVESR